jgi:glutathione S-transferase
MKVYEFDGFPNPARIRIALAEKQLSDKVQFISINVPEGEHQQAAYLEKNPSGTVPALELEDGTVISECTAITEYLDGTSGERTLTGDTPKERAVIHMMQRRAEAKLLDAVATYFHQATPGLGPDVEGEQCAQWGEIQRVRSLDGMQYFDHVLADQPYIAGDTFTMADITVFAGLAFADFANVDIPVNCTNLVSWRERVSKRPSIAG